MSSIRDRSGRFAKMPDSHENTETETPKPRPPADSMANRIEQSRVDRTVDALQADGIDARSGARQAVDVGHLDRVAAHNDGPADLEAIAASHAAERQAFEQWITGDALPVEPRATTWAVVDGHRITVPLDQAGREQAIETFRQSLADQAEAIATIDAENEGKFRCPI